MQAEASAEHRWLQRLIGEWRYESAGEAGPGEPPVHDEGTESVRALGGVWVVCEAKSNADDGTASIMTVGYDPGRKRFVGTFIGSMMTFLWLYEGELDAAGTTLVLESEGPSFAEEGKTAKYRDTMEMRTDDHRIFTSSYLADDGSWHAFMTTHYRRTR
jgi:hypothetical protein